MKIGFDARFLTHPQLGGFKTYTENLVAALPGTDRAHEYIFYVDRELDDRFAVPSAPNVSYRVVPGALPMLGMVWREQVGLARRAAQDRVDLLHAPCLTAPLRLSCPLVVTIHDVIWRRPREYAASKPRQMRRALLDAYYRVVPAWAARRASMVLTVSQFSKQGIVDELHVDPARVLVAYEAPASTFRRLTDDRAIQAARNTFGLAGDYILAIGSADPRKNLPALVRAYARLPAGLRDRTQLAIVGKDQAQSPEITDLLPALKLTREVRFLGRVSREQLVALYNAAALFAFPSLQEGFGLPLLEAMACGAPVVAADNSSIPEIAADAALLFNAEDEALMADRIRQVLTDATLRERLVQAGLRRVAAFSWDRCARDTIAAYERASVLCKR